MFITLQLSFVDLRHFLKYPLRIVPAREKDEKAEIANLEQIAKDEYVRCFGHYQLRNTVPRFRFKRKRYTYASDEKAGKLDNLWLEEYLYASTRRGLRFEFLEKQKLLNGKLVNPRAKVRALRYFPFDPGNGLWTPCMRIETGILFDVTAPLDERELADAADEFLKLKVNVPLYTREGPEAGGRKKTKLQSNTLIGQQDMLAQLIVNGTTAHQELRVTGDMIYPGQPLLTIHYTKDEISKLPKNITPLPKAAAENMNVSFQPHLGKSRIGCWLFELPDHSKKDIIKTKHYQSIRNTTITVMRYWSEFQAVISLCNAVAKDAFDFNFKKDQRMVDYLNRSTKFLLSGKWHGVSLDIIRDILNTYHVAEPGRQKLVDKIIKEFPKQIAEKLLIIGVPKPQVFVSYSHKDTAYLPLLENAFKRLQKSHQVDFFADTGIQGGEEWEKKINSKMENASIAILLISPGFIASDFINKKELPAISKRYKKGKLNIIPVLVDGGVPKDRLLSGLQFININDPLSTAAEEKKKEIMKLLTDRTLSFA